MATPTKEYWPLSELRLRARLPAGDLELRLPDHADLTALAALAEAGVHDPQHQPFGFGWTDAEPEVRALSTVQFHWRSWGEWTPERWELNLVTLLNGTVVGTQAIGASDYAVLREVHSGSWLGIAHHGEGIGTAMRAAVLALAFEGLGAEYATSGAFTDNPASLRVSRKLGYADDGIFRQVSRGKPATMRRLRLDRASWQAHRTLQVDITGLDPCLALFGAGR
jgi:RimJ/RimL family protein N-acetyltransferase